MRKVLPYIAGAVVFIAIILLLVFHKQQRTFDGRITLNPAHKIPYGTYVAYQLLQQQFPKAKVSINKEAPGEWKIPIKDTSGQTLLIVNNYFNPTAAELKSLVSFAQKGNSVFISALQMSEKAQRFFRVLQDDVYDPYGIAKNNAAINIKDSFVVKMDSSVFSSPNTFSYPGISYDNNFIKYDSIYTYPLGYNNKKVENLVAIHSLKGTFILHSAPITFTNLFLLYNNNHTYFEKLMSLLPADTKYVLWDEYFMYHKTTDDNEDNSILYVLLKYKNFRWAFWLTLIALAFYLVTELKRRQRLVPEHTSPANDTLAFVTTVGKLYYEKADHKNLAEKLSVYFLDFIRNKYKISTAEINHDFAKSVAIKSNIPLEEIVQITDTLTEIKISNGITQQQLMDYHNKLEHFYSKV